MLLVPFLVGVPRGCKQREGFPVLELPQKGSYLLHNDALRDMLCTRKPRSSSTREGEGPQGQGPWIGILLVLSLHNSPTDAGRSFLSSCDRSGRPCTRPILPTCRAMGRNRENAASQTLEDADPRGPRSTLKEAANNEGSSGGSASSTSHLGGAACSASGRR